MNRELPRDINGCTDNMVAVIKRVPLEMTKADIAKDAKMNINTVKDTIKALYNLFNVNTFAGLTRVAIQLGYYYETRKWQ